jgi:DNA helicase II / ATP-dependent DNA helicase PcrA
MGNNKLIIAAAGSGKTTFLVDEAIKIKDGNVLITTFTDANEGEIRKRFAEKNKSIPHNVTVQTWYSFLLQHGVKPYQGYFFTSDIKGINLVSGQSTQGVKKSDVAHYYFDKQPAIYNDKISQFSLECNTVSNGKVLERLSRIYQHIFIDEVQDLAGYDLNLLKELFNSNVNMLLVGDPRQGTYSTSNSNKNKQYRKGAIVHFFEDSTINIAKDETSLATNYRSIAPICDLSNRLFPQYPQTTSGNTRATPHDGIFLVKSCDVDSYLAYYTPTQLRDSKKKTIGNDYPIMNFGMSKGLAFDRVLIYPTDPITKWLKNSNSGLAATSRSKLYVAITRALYSVAFVYDFEDNEQITGTSKFDPATLKKAIAA